MAEACSGPLPLSGATEVAEDVEISPEERKCKEAVDQATFLVLKGTFILPSTSRVHAQPAKHDWLMSKGDLVCPECKARGTETQVMTGECTKDALIRLINWTYMCVCVCV